MEITHDSETVNVSINDRLAEVRVHFRKEYEPETNGGDIVVTHYNILWCDDDFPTELLTDSILIDSL